MHAKVYALLTGFLGWIGLWLFFQFAGPAPQVYGEEGDWGGPCSGFSINERGAGFRLALPVAYQAGPVFSTAGRLQLSGWQAESDGILLTRAVRGTDRQQIALLDVETAGVQILAERRYSNDRPILENNFLTFFDWEGGPAGTLSGRMVTMEMGGSGAASKPVEDWPVEVREAPGKGWVLQIGGEARLNNERESCFLQLVARAGQPPGGPGHVLEGRWSPDGGTLAVITAGGSAHGVHGKGWDFARSELVFLDFQSGKSRSAGLPVQYVTDLAWGPDAPLLAALTAELDPKTGKEKGSLWVVDLEKGTLTPVDTGYPLGGGDWGRQLLWSPDGSRLAVHCPTPEESRICLVDLGGPSAPVNQHAPSEPGQDWPAENMALPALTFTVPASLTVDMYWLTASGARRQPLTRCGPSDTAYGCTAFCSETGYGCPLNTIFPYPYFSGTITVSLESDYLPDVVPRELGTWYDATAMEAQAVAARTYALYFVANPPGSPFNNSISFQAFVPRYFERVFPENYPDDEDNQWDDPCGSDYGLLNTGQKKVCDALAAPDYMSYSGESPLLAMFAADAYGSTDDGGPPHLKGIADPISTACDADDFGHRLGMSQEGASRWGRGHECSWNGAPLLPGNSPGESWQLDWSRDQILAHYYSGIHIRDAAGLVRTPAFRWNMLGIGSDGKQQFPGLLFTGQPISIEIWLQNSGASSWLTETIGLHQAWSGPGVAYTSVTTYALVLAAGESVLLDLSLAAGQIAMTGTYSVTFDLALWEAGNWVPFSAREAGKPWPVFTAVVEVRLADLVDRAWLPIIIK